MDKIEVSRIFEATTVECCKALEIVFSNLAMKFFVPEGTPGSVISYWTGKTDWRQPTFTCSPVKNSTRVVITFRPELIPAQERPLFPDKPGKNWDGAYVEQQSQQVLEQLALCLDPAGHPEYGRKVSEFLRKPLNRQGSEKNFVVTVFLASLGFLIIGIIFSIWSRQMGILFYVLSGLSFLGGIFSWIIKKRKGMK
jgi:hypothetical protein